MEVCVDGRCEPGTPIECANPDAAHCSAVCVEEDEGQCRVTALDSDEDGHGAAACEAAPGDDCDDTHPMVFPGATETCDGRDNDCDGLDDIAEGFPVSGTPTNVTWAMYVDPQPSVSWAADVGKYVIAWSQGYSGDSTVNAAFLDEPPAISGEKTLSDVGSLGPRLVWSPAGAALAWYYRSVDPAQWQVLFQLLDANLDRQLATDVVVDTLPDSPDPTLTDLTLTRLATGDWYVGWRAPSPSNAEVLEARGRLVGATGPVGSVFVPGSTQAVRASAFEQDVLLADTTATTVRVKRLSSTLSQIGVHEVPVMDGTPSNVRMAVRDGAIALAWNVAGPRNTVQFAELDAAGQVACGPITILEIGLVDDLVTSGSASAVLVRRVDSNDIVLYRIPGGCGAPSTPVLAPGPKSSNTVGALAASPEGFAAIWAVGANVDVWLFGPNFCD